MKMNVRLGAGIGLVVCFIASVLLLLPRQSRPAVEAPRPPVAAEQHTEPVEKQSYSVSAEPVHLIGTIIPSAQASLGVMQPGRVSAILARSGSAVTAGEVILTLDSSAANAQVQQAKAGLVTARAQLRLAQTGVNAAEIKGAGEVEQARQALLQAQSGVTAAKVGVSAAISQQHAQLVGAQANVAKAQTEVIQAKNAWLGLKKIAAVGGASVMDVAGAKAQYSTAVQDLNAAKAQLQALRAGYQGGTPFQVSHAEEQLQQAQTGLLAAKRGLQLALRGAKAATHAAQSQLDAAKAGVDQAEAGQNGASAADAMTRVVSPINGVVANTSIQVGEIAQPGMPLASIVSTTNPAAEALAPARDLSRLHVGAAATVQVAGYRQIRAVVSWISPVASPDGRNFRVKFRLLDVPTHLPPASGAEITVRTRG